MILETSKNVLHRRIPLSPHLAHPPSHFATASAVGTKSNGHLNSGRFAPRLGQSAACLVQGLALRPN